MYKISSVHMLVTNVKMEHRFTFVFIINDAVTSENFLA